MNQQETTWIAKLSWIIMNVNNLRRSQKEGGSEGGMSMLTDSMVFFGTLPLLRD